MQQSKARTPIGKDPLSVVKGEPDELPSPARSYLPSYVSMGDDLSTEGDVNESPFEIEETLDPYAIVNIDRGPPVQSPFKPTVEMTVDANSSPSPEPVSSAEPKRKGELEYDTFVNIPAMRMKEMKSPVPVPKPLSVHASSKRLAGSEMGDTVFYGEVEHLPVEPHCCGVFRRGRFRSYLCGCILHPSVLGYYFLKWVKLLRSLRRQYKESQFHEYPSFGLPGSKKSRSPDSVAAMDSKLASAAQLYHFQHTKQQIISMEHPSCDVKEPISDDSEVEEDEGDYSVYECPGLAPTGDMEIDNPMFVPSNGEGIGKVKAEPNGQASKGSTQNLSNQ
ncbi:Neural proliferation differentiation and control [Trichuris trichiura]|uniref:Neural proliferation differentiation and control n=1 Tax=Trichuris trichiura TaxID=36087 RepID=A0A077YYM9_TRITR|nr:Neural proliferation differentiation and control [Trichuris trichiura]